MQQVTVRDIAHFDPRLLVADPLLRMNPEWSGWRLHSWLRAAAAEEAG